MTNQAPNTLRIGSANRSVGYHWGVLTPLICTVIAWPLHPLLGEASVLMLYMLGVFLVASRFGRGASMIASLLSAPAFAFYFASPIFSFAIRDIENIVGLVVMIVVANLTSNLLDEYKLQAELARLRENRSNALYRLSEALADATSREGVAAVAVEHIFQEFSASSALLFYDQNCQIQYPQQKPHLHSLRGAELTACLADFVAQEANNQLIQKHLLIFAKNQQALLLMKFSTAILDDAAVKSFFDTFLTLIQQSLERLYLAEKAQEASLRVETETLRNALLSAISHDLRTPLTRINGAALTWLEAGVSLNQEEGQDLAKVIVDESQRMSELTTKILNMARLTSGEIVLHQDWNAIEEIVGSALMRMDSNLQDRPIRTLISEQIPLVWLDAVLMEQVLVNLIENVVKYTPPGSPIDISAHVAGEYIELIVTDYGPGIPDGMEEKLFEKFFRIESESCQSGVGLGLALSRTVIRAHGGDIKAVNAIMAKGLALIISLPLSVPPVLDILPFGGNDG